jgi:hypothetical protein
MAVPIVESEWSVMRLSNRTARMLVEMCYRELEAATSAG